MKLVLLFVFAVLSADGAYEGEFCDANGAQGVCTNLRDCPAAQADIRNGKRPQTCQFVNNDVIVCCKKTSAAPAPATQKPIATTTRRSSSSTTEYVPQEYEYEDVNNKKGTAGCEPLPPVMTSKKTGQKAWDKCIEYQEKYVFPCEKGVALSGDFGRVNHCHHNADELIIGGTAAGKWEFPHMVLLGYINDASQIIYQCGGALISDRYVLTAGHCTANKDRDPVSHALVGALKRSDDQGGRNRYGVKRIIPHPEYKSPHKYHDIALLELDRPVPLDHSTVPACLHVAGDAVDEGRASATGWGTTVYNKDVNADVLQKVIVTKFPTSNCSSTYTANRHMMRGFDETTQICYGDRTKSKDTCQGDSGGPLQVKNKRIVCMYSIIGVTSFGQACGWADVPGIYTRVQHYVPWIESVVWP